MNYSQECQEPCRAQVANMGRVSGIEFSPSVIEEYMRRNLLGGNFYDQRLMAEVITKLDHENLIAFWRAYPQIFGAELEGITNSIA